MQEISGKSGSIKRIDGFAFARDGGEIAVLLQISEMQRLADVVVGGDGAVSANLTGSKTEDGKYLLTVQIDGILALRCQRCLTELAFPVLLERQLQLVGNATEIPEDDLEDDSTDFVVGEREMSVLALVEDEILLALPMIPAHDNCSPPAGGDAVKTGHPFAGLAKLSKH